MGHKIHPKSVRLGYIQDWESKWFSLREMPALIGEDFKIRALIKERFRLAAVSWVGIERAGSYLRVNIHTARPGVVIGKRGADIEGVRSKIEKLTSRKTFINVLEIKQPELDARLVGEAIAMQLERRINHRRAIRRGIERTMQAGALGVKVQVKGRLNGAEIARREWQLQGSVPLHTFSADIDYGLTEAFTTMGQIGIKVWIYKKLFFARSTKELREQAEKQAIQTGVPLSAEVKTVEKAAAAPVPAAPPAAVKEDAPMPELPEAALAQLAGDEPESKAPAQEADAPPPAADAEEGEE